MKRPSRLLLVPLTLLGLVAAACGSDDNGSAGHHRRAGHRSRCRDHRGGRPPPRRRRPRRRRSSGDITVFAAASLTDSFTEIGDAFTEANPDAKVTFSFDASSALVQQITQGAPADVFASADTANMDKLTDRRPQRHRAGDLRHQPA